jgi:hypothetical protein
MLPSAVSTVHRLLHLALSPPAHTLEKKLHFAEHFLSLSLLAKVNRKVEKRHVFFVLPII